MTATRQSSRDKVGTHRARLRARGLRPIQPWAPDVHGPSFVAEARRQSLAVAQGAGEADDQAFVDSIGWGSLDEDE